MLVHATSPMGLMGTIVTDDVTNGWEYQTGRYHLGNDRVSRSQMLAIVSGLTAGHLVLSGIVLFVARRLFTRCSGRTS